MMVNEIAKAANVPCHVVRYYTRIGLLNPKRQPFNDYKVFNRDDVTRVRIIRFAQSLGYTLSDITEMLHEIDRGHQPAVWMYQTLRQRSRAIREKLNELAEKQARIDTAISHWGEVQSPAPDLESLCAFVETLMRVPSKSLATCRAAMRVE